MAGLNGDKHREYVLREPVILDALKAECPNMLSLRSLIFGEWLCRELQVFQIGPQHSRPETQTSDLDIKFQIRYTEALILGH